MAVDLGPIAVSLNLDTGQFDRGADNVERRLDNLVKTTERASKQKLDISPTGGRELDQASKSADNLSRGLEGASKSADKVKAPTGVSRELDAAAGSADRLGKELDEAASSSQKIKPDPAVPSSLSKSADAARQLAEEMNRAGAEADQLGASGGGATRLEGALSGLASTARGLIPALSAAAVAGSALTKGWDRLSSIDNAQFKLQGLGHTSESTADIMNSAMESVSGTAYGFGDAASLAAGVVAATGAEGARLTEILTTVADTAAISGRSLGDMGMIFNQVAASGTLMGDDLNQLMDAGIPVLNMLADEMGVTAGEVKDLASDGEVSFEIFESAMRNSMGGAAQEMGASVSGALSNVGAALGRLGAAALDPAFKALPGILESTKTGIDGLTEGVGKAVEIWNELPAPVKAVVGGFAAAKGATSLLNTELGGKLIDHLSSLRDRFVSGASNVKNFGGAISDAYGYIRQANPEMGRFSAGMTVLAGNGGVAATAMSGLRGAAGGLLTMLGGPWGIAIAGASAAVGLFMNHVQKSRQEQEAATKATDEWANVLGEADGKLTDSVQKHAVAAIQNAEWADSLDNVSLSTADAASAVLDLGGSYEDTIEQLDEMIRSSSDYSQLRGQEREDARNHVADLRAVRDGLVEMHDQQGRGAEQAREAADSQQELATAVAESYGATSNGIPKFAEMNGILEQMGIDADTAEDAIDNLTAATMNYLYGIDPDPAIRFQSMMADSAKAVQDFGTLLADGMGGFDVETGQFNKWDEQGQKLSGTMDGLRTSLHQAAAAQYQMSIEAGRSGVDAAWDAANTAEEYTTKLREQAAAAGWNKEQIDALIDSYDLTPEEIYTRMNLEGAEVANSLMNALDESMTRVNQESYEIVVDSDALNLTKEQAEELGFTLEEVGGLTTLTADTEMARAALEEYAERTEELGTQDNTVVFRADVEQLTDALNTVDGVKAEWTTNPAELPVLVDTAESHAALEELGVKAKTIDGYLYVEDNSPEVMDKLIGLGAETAALPEGRITIDTNSPEVIELLETVGFETTRLPGGEVMLAHDDIHAAFQAMVDTGALVKQGADGELTVSNNFLENEQAVEQLKAKVREGATGAATMSHNAAEVRQAIITALEGLITSGTHKVNVEERIRSQQELGGALGIRHPLLGGGYTGGRFHNGTFDYLPAYAAGDRHDGYRLPTSGPGTDVTDGFLALDQYGMPVARLDADEWVINGESSARFDALLRAVNADDRDAILREAARLPGLAGGGTLGGSTVPSPDPATGGAFEGEATAEVTLSAEGVADELSIIGQQLETLGEGETITVDAVDEQAHAVLDELGIKATTLPDGSVEIQATGTQALDEMARVSDMLFEVGDTEVNPVALLDATELEVSAEDAQTILEALNIQEPTPYASLIIDDLLAGKGIAQGELEFLASMVPTPATDLNNALLEAGVAVAEGELQRVGNSKATSVVDVNNQSALTNVQATLDALNRMPVERTIRIVAAGSAASQIAAYENGGRIPALATGGRLPTTGPGTDRTDGILGVGSDGVPTALVDAGEWVITKNRSEQFNRTLGAINSGNQRDIYEALQADLPGIQALNKGGVVSPEQLLDFAAGKNVNGQQARQSLQGAPYIWGGVNWGDCSGAMAGLANFAAGLPAFASRFATMNQREATAALGFRPGLGDPATSFNLGWFNGGPWGGHTAGDIGGTAVEMGGGAGGQGKIGGAAASASSGQFTDHAHLTLGELWAFDLFRALPALTETYTPAPDPSYVTEGGQGVSPGGLGLQIANTLGGGVSHTGGDGVHLNNGMVIPYQKGRLYDTGGIWPTGTWGLNTTGGDEMVLPPRETEQFKALPEAAEAMYRVADAVGALHPELRRMVDDITPQLEMMVAQTNDALGQLELIADAGSVEGITARATAGRVLDFDVLPYSSEMQGMLDAEAALLEARAGQEERARAIADSEQALVQARRELEEIENTDPGMTVADQRKLADAEKAVAEARADGKADKVADAEEKLSRVREDIAANADKAAIERQEDLAKATQNITDAEMDLVEARQESVRALDSSLYSVLPQISQGLAAASGALGGLVGEVGALGGAGAQAAPMLAGVSGQLASAAALAGPAGMSIGMALSGIELALSLAREIWSILDDIVSSAHAARTFAAEGMSESMSAVREWTLLVDEQRQTVSQLQQAVVRAQIDMVAAQWEVRTAQLDVGRAQLEGVKNVATAEAALQAERERQARANWWQYNDLTLAYDRLRWAQHDVAYGQLEDYATVTPEILALQHEVHAAQLGSVGSVLTAQLASLQASKGLMDAQKAMSRGWRDLEQAREEYERMISADSWGLRGDEAIVMDELTTLLADNAKLEADRNSLGNTVKDAAGSVASFLSFGLIGSDWADTQDSFDTAIRANNERIDRIFDQYADLIDEDTLAEMRAAADRAAAQYKAGNEAGAEAILRGEVMGRAQRSLDDARLDREISEWNKGVQENEDMREDLWDTLNFEEMAQPMREWIVALQAGANSAQYSADALREQNPAVRAALERLAEFEGGASRDIAAGRPIRNITIVGNNFDADQMQELIDRLADDNQDIENRVQILEQPDRPTGHDVMAARR